MKYTHWFISIALSVSLFSLVTVAQAQKETTTKIIPLNSIVAVVNNQVVSQSELNQQMAILRNQLVQTKQPLPSQKALRDQVLQALINQRLQLQQAVKDGFSVTDQQVNATIKNVAAQNHLTLKQLQQQVEHQGLNFSAYRPQIHDQMLMGMAENQAIGHTITVSDAEAKAALKKLQQQQQNVQQYHLQAILVPLSLTANTEQMLAARTKAIGIIQQLSEGQDFEAVTIAGSTADSQLQGGDMGWKQLQQLPPTIAAAVNNANAGKVIGPLQSANGFYVIKVAAIKSVKLNVQNNATLDNARNLAYQQKFAAAVEQWVGKLRKQAYIKINDV